LPAGVWLGKPSPAFHALMAPAGRGTSPENSDIRAARETKDYREGRP
jgi:hypothetical protein